MRYAPGSVGLGQAFYAPTTSSSCVMVAVLPSMIEAEQYFSLDSSIARSTAACLRFFPVTLKAK